MSHTTAPIKKVEKKESFSLSSKSDKKSHIHEKSYSDHNIIYGSISSSDLFDRWEEDRNKMSDIVNSHTILDIFTGIFPKDTQCKGCLDINKRPYHIHYSCIGCQLIGRLFKRGEETRNKFLCILAGDVMGRELYIKHISHSLDTLQPYKEENYSKEYGMLILHKLHHMNSCEQGYSTRIINTRTFGTTSYISNYILIASILEQEMNLAKLPGVPFFRWIYECSDGLVLIEEKIGTKGSLDILAKHADYTKSPVPTSTSSKIRSLRPDVAQLLLMQIVMNLCFLNNYDFTHGEPSLHSIIITKEACVMKYENIKLECPFSVHIIPSGNSSMTINVNDELIRIFHKSIFELTPIHLNEINKIEFKVNLGITVEPSICIPTDSFMCDAYKNRRVLYYKIGNSNVFDLYTSHMGIALFPSSFDTYAFFVALMVEESYYQTILHDDNLLKIWKSMWRSDEYDFVMSELSLLRKLHSETHTPPQYGMIRNMLGKLYLRCDGLHFLWQMLKNISNL